MYIINIKFSIITGASYAIQFLFIPIFCSRNVVWLRHDPGPDGGRRNVPGRRLSASFRRAGRLSPCPGSLVVLYFVLNKSSFPGVSESQF